MVPSDVAGAHRKQPLTRMAPARAKATDRMRLSIPLKVTTSFEPRPVCARCRRPMRACYCAHLPRIETKTRVVVVQHPRERDVPIGTARMATLCLPNSELHVVTSVASEPALERALSDPSRPAILLSPGE